MKKILLISILNLIIANTSFANITIWCKGDYEKGSRNGTEFNNKLDISYSEVMITDTFIKFKNLSSMPVLPRDKKNEDLDYRANQMINLDWDSYTIDRTSGVLKHFQIRKGFISTAYYNCVSSKPTVKF
ncbi:hypothetical protein OA107_04295 [Candidatus Pelagibacter sp.]|nr:hypothetical protein [Candidatus Pelagibacter sp.]